MAQRSAYNINLDDTNLLKKKPRYEELAMPKIRIDNSKRLNAFQVRPGALTYEITESLNKLAQPKRRYSSESYRYSSPSFLSLTPSLKPETLSKESSSIKSPEKKESNESSKPKVETYANIAARRNSRYFKRFRDFSRPMKNLSELGSGSSNSQSQFSQMMKTYNQGNKQTLSKESSSIKSPEKKGSSESSKPKVETYANIAARRNSRYFKRFRDFSRPMKNLSELGSGSSNSQSQFSQMIKTYNQGNKR